MLLMKNVHYFSRHRLKKICNKYFIYTLYAVFPQPWLLTSYWQY